MTRQIIVLLLSIVIIIFGGIWEAKYINRTAGYLSADVEYTKNAIHNNNYEVAKKQITELEDTWKNAKKAWNIFVQHDLIDSIENSIAELKMYVESEDKKESLALAERLMRNIWNVSERQYINLENVF